MPGYYFTAKVTQQFQANIYVEAKTQEAAELKLKNRDYDEIHSEWDEEIISIEDIFFQEVA